MPSNNEIRDILTEEEIEKIVENSLKSKRKYQIIKYEIISASDAPMGFLGDHFKAKIDVRYTDDEKISLNYFVKTTPRSVHQHLEYTLSTRAFFKEIELYKTLFSHFTKVQTKPKKWHPDYLYSREDELIVMEDLSKKGYYMIKERSLMDLDHVKASLRAMAAMHASSFTLKYKLSHGNLGEHNLEGMKSEKGNVSLGEVYSHLIYETEISDAVDHPGNTFINVGIMSQVPLVDLLEKYTEAEKCKIKEKLPSILGRIFPLVKPSEEYENVFIHGDLWANNILFRKNNNETVADAILIDFQLARYAPPAHDLMMFFHLVQNKNFRDEKQEELINYYYDLLSEELKSNGVPVETALEKNKFLRSCRHYRELGLISAALYFQLILAPSHVSSKFMASTDLYQNIMLVDRSDMIKECFNEDKTFRMRMSEAMEELITEYILV